MNKRPMPDWMMQYVSNIGTDDCFKDFRQLSKDYYTAIDSKSGGAGKAVYNYEMLNINRSFKWDKSKPKTDAEKADITERYKKEASQLAEKHGCERPSYESAVDKKTNEMRHNNPQEQFISREDPIAKKSINDYQKKYPEKATKSQDNADKYRDRELKEYDRDKSHEHNAKMFDKTQDRFEATRLSEKEKHDQRDNPSPDAVKHSMSSKFFVSLGMDNDKLQSVKDQYNKSASPQKDSEKDDTKNKDGGKTHENMSQSKNTDKSDMADNFLKNQSINKTDIPKANNTGKPEVSYSYLGSKGSDNSPNKTPDVSLDKD
ncbi:hypothetical protein E6C50_01015 [Flavobacterium supellecticarium]|uniref:Uncharacterized protein n=1 Tax=Flavobacterium supellecticarium TaxID=2565924 RepID=A0A4S4A333_9FLAO|nr:hypothetical protein [Flavobacterium supellecticarium]THF52822.1 hypothetical protein E6C50_01015 [Flavobacterium supellecticarium]